MRDHTLERHDVEVSGHRLHRGDIAVRRLADLLRDPTPQGEPFHGDQLAAIGEPRLDQVAEPERPDTITATDEPATKRCGVGSCPAVSMPCVTAITSVSAARSDGSSSGTLKSGVPGSRYISSAQPPNRCGGRLALRLFP